MEIDRAIIDRILSWDRGEPAAPVLLELRFTKLCNLQCIHCGSRNPLVYTPEEELSGETYLRIIEEAGEIGVDKVRIVGGGEPFSRQEDLLAIMETAKARGLEGEVFTNGTLITEETAERLVTMKWDMVTISLDGADAETNDAVRKGSRGFKEIMQSVAWINRYKERHDSERPRMTFAPVLTAYNASNMRAMVELAREHRISNFIVQPYCSAEENDLTRRLRMSPDQRDTFLADLPELIGLADGYGIRSNLDSYRPAMIESLTEDVTAGIEESRRRAGEHEDEPRKKPTGDPQAGPAAPPGRTILDLPCYIPWYILIIDVDGTAYSCVSENHSIGNAGTQSLEELWYGSAIQKLRKSLGTIDIHAECKTCCANFVVETNAIREALHDSLGR